MRNAVSYGMMNYMPGIQGTAPPSSPILQKKKDKKQLK
jgi:hypothetical protein